MAHLETKDWLLFTTVFLLGVIGAVLDMYFLVLVSLIVLYITLSISVKFQRHELCFLFPLSFISYLPLNLKFSKLLVEAVDFAFAFTIQRVFCFVSFLLVLISVEELILGILGVAVWGNQEAIFYKDEDQKESKIHGHYIEEITVDKLFEKQNSKYRA